MAWEDKLKPFVGIAPEFDSAKIAATAQKAGVKPDVVLDGLLRNHPKILRTAEAAGVKPDVVVNGIIAKAQPAAPPQVGAPPPTPSPTAQKTIPTGVRLEPAKLTPQESAAMNRRNVAESDRYDWEYPSIPPSPADKPLVESAEKKLASRKVDIASARKAVADRARAIKAERDALLAQRRPAQEMESELNMGGRQFVAAPMRKQDSERLAELGYTLDELSSVDRMLQSVEAAKPGGAASVPFIGGLENVARAIRDKIQDPRNIERLGAGVAGALLGRSLGGFVIGEELAATRQAATRKAVAEKAATDPEDVAGQALVLSEALRSAVQPPIEFGVTRALEDMPEYMASYGGKAALAGIKNIRDVTSAAKMLTRVLSAGKAGLKMTAVSPSVVASVIDRTAARYTSMRPEPGDDELVATIDSYGDDLPVAFLKAMGIEFIENFAEMGIGGLVRSGGADAMAKSVAANPTAKKGLARVMAAIAKSKLGGTAAEASQKLRDLTSKLGFGGTGNWLKDAAAETGEEVLPIIADPLIDKGKLPQAKELAAQIATAGLTVAAFSALAGGGGGRAAAPATPQAESEPPAEPPTSPVVERPAGDRVEQPAAPESPVAGRIATPDVASAEDARREERLRRKFQTPPVTGEGLAAGPGVTVQTELQAPEAEQPKPKTTAEAIRRSLDESLAARRITEQQYADALRAAGIGVQPEAKPFDTPVAQSDRVMQVVASLYDKGNTTPTLSDIMREMGLAAVGPQRESVRQALAQAAENGWVEYHRPVGTQLEVSVTPITNRPKAKLSVGEGAEAALPAEEVEPSEYAPQAPAAAPIRRTGETPGEPFKPVELRSGFDPTKAFSRSTTDMPLYDELLKNPGYFRRQKDMDGKVVMMPPDEYMQRQAIALRRDLAGDMAVLDQERIDEYADAMKNGAVFPMPVVEYVSGPDRVGHQEGRHRAMAAKKLGIKEIPVLVVKPTPAAAPGERGATELHSGIDPFGYRGRHTAPDNETGAPMSQMDRGIYPSDIYTRDGARLYGDRVDEVRDRAMHELLVSVRGNPDAQVTVYRAVPRGVSAAINPGDWVTPDREYAASHGERFGEYEIVEKSVRAGDLFTEGNSLYEYGYQPPSPRGPVGLRAGFKLPPLADFKDWVSRYTEFDTKSERDATAKDARAFIADMPDRFPVYRAVAAESADKVDVSDYGRGESWTPSLNAARRFANVNLPRDSKVFIIRAMANKSDIDIPGTVAAYAQNSAWDDPDAEMEAVIGGRAKLTDISVVGESDATRLGGDYLRAGLDPTATVREFGEWLTGATEADKVAEAERQYGAVKVTRDAQGRLTAPNGKPSKLNERQYRQVRTPFFKRWFGNGVVDENGEPLVVYHGTDKDFTEFKRGDIGIHLGTAEQAATRTEHRRIAEGQNIIPAFAAIRNPLRLSDAGDWTKPWNVAYALVDAGLVTEDEVKFAMGRNLAATIDKTGADPKAVMDRALVTLRNKIQQLGYDGVVYSNIAEGKGDSYIAFSPTQIKSAVANRGTYSPETGNILRAGVNFIEAYRAILGELGEPTSGTLADLRTRTRGVYDLPHLAGVPDEQFDEWAQAFAERHGLVEPTLESEPEDAEGEKPAREPKPVFGAGWGDRKKAAPGNVVRFTDGSREGEWQVAERKGGTVLLTPYTKDRFRGKEKAVTRVKAKLSQLAVVKTNPEAKDRRLDKLAELGIVPPTTKGEWRSLAARLKQKKDDGGITRGEFSELVHTTVGWKELPWGDFTPTGDKNFEEYIKSRPGGKEAAIVAKEITELHKQGKFDDFFGRLMFWGFDHPRGGFIWDTSRQNLIGLLSRIGGEDNPLYNAVYPALRRGIVDQGRMVRWSTEQEANARKTIGISVADEAELVNRRVSIPLTNATTKDGAKVQGYSAPMGSLEMVRTMLKDSDNAKEVAKVLGKGKMAFAIEGATFISGDGKSRSDVIFVDEATWNEIVKAAETKVDERLRKLNDRRIEMYNDVSFRGEVNRVSQEDIGDDMLDRDNYSPRLRLPGATTSIKRGGGQVYDDETGQYIVSRSEMQKRTPNTNPFYFVDVGTLFHRHMRDFANYVGFRKPSTMIFNAIDVLRHGITGESRNIENVLPNGRAILDEIERTTMQAQNPTGGKDELSGVLGNAMNKVIPGVIGGRLTTAAVQYASLVTALADMDAEEQRAFVEIMANPVKTGPAMVAPEKVLRKILDRAPHMWVRFHGRPAQLATMVELHRETGRAGLALQKAGDILTGPVMWGDKRTMTLLYEMAKRGAELKAKGQNISEAELENRAIDRMTDWMLQSQMSSDPVSITSAAVRGKKDFLYRAFTVLSSEVGKIGSSIVRKMNNYGWKRARGVATTKDAIRLLSDMLIYAIALTIIPQILKQGTRFVTRLLGALASGNSALNVWQKYWQDYPIEWQIAEMLGNAATAGSPIFGKAAGRSIASLVKGKGGWGSFNFVDDPLTGTISRAVEAASQITQASKKAINGEDGWEAATGEAVVKTLIAWSTLAGIGIQGLLQAVRDFRAGMEEPSYSGKKSTPPEAKSFGGGIVRETTGYPPDSERGGGGRVWR